MAMLPLLFTIFVSFTDLTEGAGVLPDGPLKAAVGETVMFTTTLNPTDTPFLSVTWTFQNSKVIITSSTLNVTDPEYEGRITLVISTGSLELRNLALNDTGEYTVTITPAGEIAKAGRTTLEIYERVTNIMVTSSNTDLIEFSDSVSLSCSCSGSSLSFLWLNDSSEVTANDRVHLTDGGSSLTIMNVTRFDQGPFRCNVFNPVSSGTSDPVNLSISYGPEYINLILSPSQGYHVVGSNIDLSCSAACRPPAQYEWFLNGDLLSDTGPELRLNNVSMGHSGNYSCRAFNNKTLKYQTSQPSGITILEKMSDASVKSSTNLPIEGAAVSLTCEASGSVFTRKWMKDGSDLTLADNMNLSDNNRVLSFNNVNRKDKGEYFCQLSNPISSDEANYVMVVNYGPDNAEVKGPNTLSINSNLNLTCSADTTPPAGYTWFFNGTEILSNSSEYIKKVDFSDSGNYTCQARNNITKKTSTSAIHELTVTEPSSGCTAGCIAGIVIACSIIVAAAGGGGYYIYTKRKPEKKSNPRGTSTITGDKGQDNAAYSNQELHYADVKFFPKKNGGNVQDRPQEDSAEYVQVMHAASSPPAYDVHMKRVKKPVC